MKFPPGKNFPRLAGLLLLCLANGVSAAPDTGQPKRGTCITLRDGRTACPQPESQCLADRYGDFRCSPTGGEVGLDRYGDPVCGPGHCAKDIHGEIFCSGEAHGPAGIDRYGNAVCFGNCVPAKKETCLKLQ